MKEIPFDMIWGIDVAIKKLRPNAKFQLEGTNFTLWECSDNSNPPNWNEVMGQLMQDQEAGRKWLEKNQE